MIRYLWGLNKADILHELKILGIRDINPRWVRGIRENMALKVSGIFPEKFPGIWQFLNKFVEVTIIPPPDESPRTGFVFFLPPAAKKKFQQQILQKAPEEFSGFAGALKTLLEKISREHWNYSLPGGGQLLIDRPLIMGILNITPDSFSDGGKFFETKTAQQHATEMLAAGADIIDIGGESTRPGSERVSVEEEWNRVAPVLRHLAKLDHCIISIDTYKSEIARRALAEGAHIINDVSGITFDPRMAEAAAKYNAPVILMHMQGTPETMQKSPSYKNLMEEILQSLDQKCRFAVERGVSQLIVDPGIGFGKRFNDNFELIRRLGELRSLGYPILLGTSRKSFIGKLLNLPPEERLPGTIASILYGVTQGANIVRVHDVAEIKQAVLIYQAIREKKAI
jgi:dihydropteroate synthase